MTKVTIYDSDVSVAGTNSTKRSGHPEFRFSGRLDTSISIGDEFDDVYTTWIEVSTRDHDVTVSLVFNGDTQVYTVKAGAPLMLPNELAVSFTFVSFAAADATKIPDVEIQTYTGTPDKSPKAAPAFLILNAGVGIAEDEFDAGKVDSWTDTRPTTSAPLAFIWSDLTAKPNLIASDPTFGGKPSVSWPDNNNTSAFTYASASSDIFNFMRGRAESGQDFTVLTILSVEDTALAARISSGIWNTSKSASFAGFRASVEGGYRTYIEASDTTIKAEHGDKELIEKPTVMIWHYTGTSQTMRVYRQGEWETSVNMAHTESSNDSSPFELGFVVGSNQTTMNGKIADIRVYDRVLSSDELDDYILMGTSEYGIDDTIEQGNPLVSSSVNHMRANRGLTLNTFPVNSFGGWVDMRIDATAGATTAAAVDFPVVSLADSVFNGHRSIIFDGVDDSLTNGMTGTAGDHLGGDNLTIGIIYYRSDTVSVREGLFTMSAYASGTLDGTNIAYDGGVTDALHYEIEQGSGSDVVTVSGEVDVLNSPRLVILRTDGATFYKVTEYTIATDATVSKVGATIAAASTTTTAPTYLFSYVGAGGYLAGGLAEYFTVASMVSDDTVAELIAYAKRRYGP